MNSTDILLKEYQTIRQEILTAMSSRISILSFGLGTIGLLLTAGMATNTLNSGSFVSGLILFLLVPAITDFVLFMWLGEYNRMQRAGKFLVELESKINHEAQSDLLTWETQLRKNRRHMKYPYNTTVMLLVLISVISVIIGVIVLNIPILWGGELLIIGIVIHGLIYRYAVSRIDKLRE